MSMPDERGRSLQRRVRIATFLLVVFTLVLGYMAMRRDSDLQEDEFIRLSNVGKNYLDSGQAAKAIEPFSKALALQPNHTNALLNLVNAYLQADQPQLALPLAQKARTLDPQSGAAHYLEGCAALRLGQFTNALQALQQAKQIDRTINAVSFQLGRAYQSLGQNEQAAEQFKEVIQFEPAHPSANYNLSQTLLRLDRQEEAQQALEAHQKVSQGKPQITSSSFFERCVYTEALVPFKLEQPNLQGIPVTFQDATAAAFGMDKPPYQGPAGILDLEHNGQLSLFVREGADGFRWLTNAQGKFTPAKDRLPAAGPGPYHQCFVGDLNNDRVEDVLILGQTNSHAYRLATNGVISDITLFSRARQLTGRQGVLADLEFTGKLDLIAAGDTPDALHLFRNMGQPYFVDATTNAGLATNITGVAQVLVDDWNGDDLLDLVLIRPGKPPECYAKLRGGLLALTNTPAAWPAADCAAFADLNNDLLPDFVSGKAGQIVCSLNGVDTPLKLDTGGWSPRLIRLWDFDNDGWLDILAAGKGLRLWRNRGSAGFHEVSTPTALLKLPDWNIQSVQTADLDLDGDSDLLIERDSGALNIVRNDGGNANHQLKVHLIGTKSNASGLGIRLEILTGGLRLGRRVHSLPIEIGVGQNRDLNALWAHWFDFNQNTTDVKVEAGKVVSLMEFKIDPGSCPYLYVWNGERFEFVTDVLGASPLGLPLSENKFIDADPVEHLWLGDLRRFQPRQGQYLVQLTEELREVLYLDEVRLVVIDHPPGTEVHTTFKMLPGKPFPKPGFLTLHRRHPLHLAQTHHGREVTALLQEADQQWLSPAQLRVDQLRGLAEPHSVTLDFGPLDSAQPLVLALTGWLRFGGGTANIAASHDPSLPFPFPTLEAELPSGAWQPVPVTVGTPAGKTKTILVDLENQLPAGTRRLRLGTAFEIHWDRIALFEKAGESHTVMRTFSPSRTDLHWRGFSEFKSLSWQFPRTPDYDRVRSRPEWRITPTGWCTRYGPVQELVDQADNALVLVNGGDELTLGFEASLIPSLPEGRQRDFFLHLVGWDKDSDTHCTLGWQVEPLPWLGMDSQRYGSEPRPAFLNDDWISRYNTRWVGPKVFSRLK